MNVETALAPAVASAAAVARFVEAQRSRWVRPKPIFAAWIGAGSEVSQIFNRSIIPCYATETEAVRGFTHLVRHGEAIDALMATPPSLPQHFKPNVAAARQVVEAALAEGRAWLDPLECAELLKAYAIPHVTTIVAHSPAEAEAAAAPLLSAGNAVAAKILSRDIVHKSDVGGVRLNLVNGHAVRSAATDMRLSIEQGRHGRGPALQVSPSSQ